MIETDLPSYLIGDSEIDPKFVSIQEIYDVPGVTSKADDVADVAGAANKVEDVADATKAADKVNEYNCYTEVRKRR